MNPTNPLYKGLSRLGQLLDEQDKSCELLVIGGGALLIQGALIRISDDIDAVARRESGCWTQARPFPPWLITAIEYVAKLEGLKPDWLNAGPSILFELGILPPGFESRAQKHTFGRLVIFVPSRRDMLFLKFYSATDIRRASRRAVDLADLKRLNPSREEILDAARWAYRMDGTTSAVDAYILPALKQLGFHIESSEVLAANGD